MPVVNLVIGAALLLAGRKVFWLFIAGAGFVAGFSLATRLLRGPDWLTFLVGLGIGLLAALVAVFAQHFALTLAGFLAGGYIAMYFLPLLHLDRGWLTWLAFLLGGIIGVFLVSALLDWALIILSSLAGASLITQTLDWQRGLDFLTFVVLAAVGIAVQVRQRRKEGRTFH
ncbi:MAG: hypothetical protein Fur0043_00890 [Anaerolineales bacterium]